MLESSPRSVVAGHAWPNACDVLGSDLRTIPGPLHCFGIEDGNALDFAAVLKLYIDALAVHAGFFKRAELVAPSIAKSQSHAHGYLSRICCWIAWFRAA